MLKNSDAVVIENNLVKVDGVVVFKATRNEDESIIIQFCDDDRMRSSCRGDRYIEMSLDEFIQRIKELV